MTNLDPGAPTHQYDWQNPNSKSFDFGRVLGRSFTGVFANVKPLIISILIAIVITIVMAVISTQQLQNLIGDGSLEEISAATLSPSYWSWSILAAIPGLFLTLWVQLIVVQTSYSSFTNSPLPSTPLKSALGFVLPMFVIALIYTIVCSTGWVLFFIGFFFVWPGWALAGPILVHEKKGIFGSLGEAWALSRGSKRWIFLLLLILTILCIVIYSVAMGVGLVATGLNAFDGNVAANLNMSIGQQVIYNLIFGFAGYFVYALFASALTAAYVEIKTMKGGTASVGDIFS